MQEALTRAAASFFQENHVVVVDVGLQVWTHPKCAPISHELIIEALRFVLDVTHHPLLVMSSSGTHQVGSLIGCLRRLQRWSFAATLEEYRSYAAPTPRLFCEQFIELWDVDLLHLPQTPPSWLEQQKVLLDEDLDRWQEWQHGDQSRPEEKEACVEEGPDAVDEPSSDAEVDELAEESDFFPSEDGPSLPGGVLGEVCAADFDARGMESSMGVLDYDYFRVTAPLVNPGTVTSVVDRED